MFSAGSWRSAAPIHCPVSGVSCISPRAPAAETAFRRNPDSFAIIATTRIGSTPCCSAFSRMRRPYGNFPKNFFRASALIGWNASQSRSVFSLVAARGVSIGRLISPGSTPNAPKNEPPDRFQATPPRSASWLTRPGTPNASVTPTSTTNTPRSAIDRFSRTTSFRTEVARRFMSISGFVSFFMISAPRFIRPVAAGSKSRSRLDAGNNPILRIYCNFRKKKMYILQTTKTSMFIVVTFSGNGLGFAVSRLRRRDRAGLGRRRKGTTPPLPLFHPKHGVSPTRTARVNLSRFGGHLFPDQHQVAHVDD